MYTFAKQIWCGMVNRTVHENLLHELGDDWQMMSEQIALLDAHVDSNEPSEFGIFLKQAGLVVAEIFCYLLFLGTLYLLFTMHQNTAFGVLTDAYQNAHGMSVEMTAKINTLIIAGYGTVLLCGILFLVLGLATARLRKKNAEMADIHEDLRGILAQQQVRKLAIETLDQQLHLQMEKPDTQFPGKDKVNNVKNPGFDDEE